MKVFSHRVSNRGSARGYRLRTMTVRYWDGERYKYTTLNFDGDVWIGVRGRNVFLAGDPKELANELMQRIK